MSSNGHGPASPVAEKPFSLLNESEKEEKILQLSEQLGYAHNNMELMTEAIAELELAMEDIGWFRMSGWGDREFSFMGLKKIRRLARLSYLKNPLIRHGVEVQTHYVWGQGCSVSARNEEINNVIRRFVDDPKNTSTFTGHQARLDKERELATHGDLFLALFTNQATGRVIVRSIFPDEVTDIITNPQDRHEPWYYKREWAEAQFDPGSGVVSSEPQICFYPDWRLTYNKSKKLPKPKSIGGHPVIWDAPVYHVKVGGFSDMKFGVPEVYSALDWARAVKDDLSDYATIRRAHSRYAWKMVSKTKGGVKTAKDFLSSTLNIGGSGSMEHNPPPIAGSTLLQTENFDFTPIKTAGMVPSPEEGKRLWLLCAAGMGIPLTILSGDADVGNLATAKTLDRPTELQMESRRTLWADVNIDILNYVIDQAAIKPQGALAGKGRWDIDRYSGEGRVVIDGIDDRDISFQFPSILERDVRLLVAAIVSAVTLNGKQNAGLFDDKTIATMLLTALGEDEVDPIVNRIFPGSDLTFDAGKGSRPAPGQSDQGIQDTDNGGMGDMGDEPTGNIGAINPGSGGYMDMLNSVRRGAAQIFVSEALAARDVSKGRSRMMAVVRQK